MNHREEQNYNKSTWTPSTCRAVFSLQYLVSPVIIFRAVFCCGRKSVTKLRCSDAFFLREEIKGGKCLREIYCVVFRRRMVLFIPEMETTSFPKRWKAFLFNTSLMVWSNIRRLGGWKLLFKKLENAKHQSFPTSGVGFIVSCMNGFILSTHLPK